MFTVIKNGQKNVLSSREIGKWIASNSTSSQEIVLLTCTEGQAAQNVANASNRSIIMFEGVTEVHSTGYIKGEGTCYRFKPNEGIGFKREVVSKPPKGKTGSVASNGEKMVLGSGQGAGTFNEFLTVEGKVKKAGNKSNQFNSFSDVDNTNIPSKYLNNEQRFSNLAKDPDQGFAIKKSTRKEAMSGLEAESQGLISNIERGPKGIEFYDVNRTPWDVKTPYGDYFNVESIGGAIKKELTEAKTIDGLLHPAGKFIDPVSGQAKFKNIILDCTYINESQLSSLRSWLKNQSGLTQAELDRIIEINTNI